jgi:hypothetical protein
MVKRKRRRRGDEIGAFSKTGSDAGSQFEEVRTLTFLVGDHEQIPAPPLSFYIVAWLAFDCAFVVINVNLNTGI